MVRDDRENQDLIIDVEIPDDIDMGIDFDGLPMVVAKEKPKADPKVDKPELKKPDPVKPDADIARLTRERDEATALAQRIAREADERLASERAARIKAEGNSAEDRGVAMRAHWSKVTAEAQAIDTALASAKQMAATAKAQLRAAKESGDLDGEVVAQERLAQAMQDQRELETGKRGAVEEVERVRGILRSMAEVEAAPKPELFKPEPIRKPEPKQQTPDDWIAQFPKETTGAWLSEHKDFVTDDKKHRKLMRYVEDLVDDHGQGFLHSQDFVDKLNERFFPKAAKQEDDVADKDEDGVEVETAEPEAPAKASIPAAPVSRGSPGNSSGSSRRGKILLTAEQAAIAPHLYPDKTPQEARVEYGLDLLRAKKDGKFDSRV